MKEPLFSFPAPWKSVRFPTLTDFTHRDTHVLSAVYERLSGSYLNSLMLQQRQAEYALSARPKVQSEEALCLQLPRPCSRRPSASASVCVSRRVGARLDPPTHRGAAVSGCTRISARSHTFDPLTDPSSHRSQSHRGVPR
eukprot:GHVU01190754.1.p1 GENE.GHVU01190754.1~~GHVU01190754.1.p1  ORF type:complete len:140 (-),score=0.20 GHVU01190754.1:488-907(-)